MYIIKLLYNVCIIILYTMYIILLYNVCIIILYTMYIIYIIV